MKFSHVQNRTQSYIQAKLIFKAFCESPLAVCSFKYQVPLGPLPFGISYKRLRVVSVTPKFREHSVHFMLPLLFLHGNTSLVLLSLVLIPIAIFTFYLLPSYQMLGRLEGGANK